MLFHDFSVLLFISDFALAYINFCLRDRQQFSTRFEVLEGLRSPSYTYYIEETEAFQTKFKTSFVDDIFEQLFACRSDFGQACSFSDLLR